MIDGEGKTDKLYYHEPKLHIRILDLEWNEIGGHMKRERKSSKEWRIFVLCKPAYKCKITTFQLL